MHLPFSQLALGEDPRPYDPRPGASLLCAERGSTTELRLGEDPRPCEPRPGASLLRLEASYLEATYLP